jgi:hypothetical protein
MTEVAAFYRRLWTPLELRHLDVPDGILFRIESERSFIATGSLVVEKRLVDIVRNEVSETASFGLGAIRPVWRVSGGCTN